MKDKAMHPDDRTAIPADIPPRNDSPSPRRPWWLRKSLILFAFLWLVLIYPFSMGPVHYACQRQWLPWNTYRVYKPLKAVLGERGMYATYLWHWDMFWSDLGWEHYRSENSSRLAKSTLLRQN